MLHGVGFADARHLTNESRKARLWGNLFVTFLQLLAKRPDHRFDSRKVSGSFLILLLLQLCSGDARPSRIQHPCLRFNETKINCARYR